MSKATVPDPAAGPASARKECAPRRHSLSRKTGSPFDIAKPRGVDFVEPAGVSDRYSLSAKAIR